MTLQHFRAHRTAHLSVSVTLSAIGLALGPLIMDPSYRLMRPAFQGTTLLWVELLFAFLIDFPLTMAATAVICALTRCRNQGDAVTAGLAFLGIFFSLVLLCIAIGDRVPGIGALALTDVFPPALSAARRAFGDGALAALMALYLVFDVTLCALGALAGHWFVRIASRRERECGRCHHFGEPQLLPAGCTRRRPIMASTEGVYREAENTGRARKRERRRPPGPASGSLRGQEPPHHG